MTNNLNNLNKTIYKIIMRKVIFCGAVNRPPGGGPRSEDGVAAYGTDVVYVVYVVYVIYLTDGAANVFLCTLLLLLLTYNLGCITIKFCKKGGNAGREVDFLS